jgi:hypothetical protein
MASRLCAGLALLLLLVGMTRGEPGEKKALGPLTAKQLESAWADFGLSDDAGTEKALEGIEAMMATPKLAVPFLKDRLKPVPAPDGKRIQQLIADLDGKDFKTRDKAAKELEALGPLAAPALEKLLQEKLPLDLQRRVETLLERGENKSLTVDELRAIRGIEVLRGIGNAEAVVVLEALAKGADGAVITAQARKALSGLKPSR